MSVELATAYVSIVPSTRGIGRRIQDGVGGPLSRITEQAGVSGGRGFASNFVGQAMSGMDRLGEGLVDRVGVWSRRAAILGAGVVTAGLVGGMRRVLDTEDAAIAFRQMGMSVEEVERAMKGVDRTFDGTPFANPDGFNITAQLLSSGRGLEQVEDDLRGIANVTAQTLDKDLNRTSETFLRIASTGRMYATDLRMLALQGIPIRQILADGLDVSADALSSMVSNGEITFDVLMDVIGATERFDGAAQAMGSSTRGAFSNVLTGVSRLGESFLGPLFGENGYAVQALLGIRSALRDLTPAADDLGRRFAGWLVPAVQSAAEWFSGTLVPAVQSAVEWFGEHREEIGRVVRAIVPAVAGVAGIAASINLVSRALALTPIGLVFTLATGLVYAYQNSERFRNVVNNAFKAVARVAGPIIETISGLVGGLFGAFQTGGADGVFAQLSASVSDAWPSIQEGLGQIINGIGSWIVDVVPVIARGLVNWGRAFIEWVVPLIPPALRELGKLLGALGTWILDDGLPLLVEHLAKWGAEFVGWIAPKIPDMLAALGDLLGDLGEWILTDALPKIVAKVAEWGSAFVGWVAEAGPRLIRRLVAWWWGSAFPWFADLPLRIIKAIGDLAGKFWDLGKEAGESFIQGIEASALSSDNKLIQAGFWSLFKNPTSPISWLTRHDGGVVPGRPGEEVPTLLMAGETVLPTHKPDWSWDVAAPARGGVTIENIDARGTDDPLAMADHLRRLLGWEMANAGVV